MSDILVSISMLAYNHEAFIGRAIESVLMQKTNFPFQLVISEDLSTDRTREICVMYKNRFPDRIKLILNENNLGSKKNAINNLANCTGKYTAICEGDDYWTDEHKLQAQVELMEKNPQYPMCFTNSVIVDGSGKVIKESRVPDDKKRNISQREILEGFCPPTNTIVFKTELLKTLPAQYGDVVNGDYFLSIYFTEFGDAAYINKITASYRMHEGGLWSRQSDEYKCRNSLKTFEILYDYFKPRYSELIEEKIRICKRELAGYEEKKKKNMQPKLNSNSTKAASEKSVINTIGNSKAVKNIVISGTNFWNPGDDFVRDGVIRILKTIFPETQLNFLFYNFNQDFFPQNKFSGIHNMVSAGDLNLYKDFVDAVVIAGLSAGTEIKDLYNWVIENNLTDRVYLIGAGYENDYVDHFIKEEPELTIFKNAKIITGRTNKRPQLITDLKLPYKHINCPAILSVENAKAVPEDKKIEKIAFSIQLPHGIGVPNHSCNASMYEMSIVLLSELFGKYDIELIAHHKSEYFHFLNLFKQFNVPVKIIFSSFYQDLFNIYPQYDLVITTRLHASLFANGFGIPGIIINDTDRHTHCLEGFKHSHWVNSKEKFYEVFHEIQNKKLSEISSELNSFKNKLIAKYVENLCKPFGVKISSLSAKPAAERELKNKLPLHFFTIVLNGKPFIEYHINVFNKLPFDWHWHIIEGVAELKHDTAWSVENGGTVNESLHKNGLSNDGTSEYLDELQKKYPGNITVYRKGSGGFWDGKLEMVNEPLKNISEECILWQVDADELWTVEQISETRKLFIADKDKSAAYFYCRYFVGENLFISTKDTYGNHSEYEWLRVWRFEPGDKWLSHEPPALSREIMPDIWVDLGKIDPFSHEETNSKNLVFQHYAYVTEEQLKFKETYYGYAGALQKWKDLNMQESFPVSLKDFFDWVNDGSVVEFADKRDFTSLAEYVNNAWKFNYKTNSSNKSFVLKTDLDYNAQAEEAINSEELLKARRLLNCALNISEKNNTVKNNLAVVEILENDFESAMETLTGILKADPADQVALGNKKALEDILLQNNIVLKKEYHEVEKIQPNKNYLFQINFDLNDGCNLDCIMCGNVPNKKYKNQSVMDESVFMERFVKVFNYATVFQFGCFFEPLMVPYFEKAVWAIKQELKPGVKGTIISNGMLLTQSKIEAMVDSDIFSKIRFSIDSVSEELFEKIRSGAKLKKLLDHIQKLVAYRDSKQSKSQVEVNFTIMRENMHELPQLVLLAKEYGIDSITTHKLTPDDVAYVDDEYYKQLTDNVAKAAELAKENGISFCGQVYYTKDTYNATINKQIERVCGYEKRNYFLLTIDCHGNITHPCKLLDNKFGSLVNKSFEEILADAPFQNLIRSVQNPRPEICTSCGMFV